MITVAVSTPAPHPRFTNPVNPPQPTRTEFLVTEILSCTADCYTAADLLDLVEGWGAEEWAQVDLDPAAPFPTADERAAVIAILTDRVR